jgi:hypothetical protein
MKLKINDYVIHSVKKKLEDKWIASHFSEYSVYTLDDLKNPQVVIVDEKTNTLAEIIRYSQKGVKSLAAIEI